jgi:hypothetical protein
MKRQNILLGYLNVYFDHFFEPLGQKHYLMWGLILLGNYAIHFGTLNLK